MHVINALQFQSMVYIIMLIITVLELNIRIGLGAMTFGKPKCMVFTSKKVSLRVKSIFYSAMVLSVLLHRAE